MGANYNTLNFTFIILTVKVAKHWQRLPERLPLESPSMKTVKNQVDVVPGKLLQLAQLEQGVWIR